MRRQRPHALLQINELVTSRTPYWIYRDMTWSQVNEHGGDTATGIIQPRIVRHACRREIRLYRGAQAVFTFSEWAARAVRATSGARTVVVPPGINVPVAVRAQRSERTNILFVGRAFARKGGYASSARLTCFEPLVLTSGCISSDRMYGPMTFPSRRASFSTGRCRSTAPLNSSPRPTYS